MTRFLAVTRSVHETAALADYLDARAEPGAAEVVVLVVAAPDLPEWDADDALNVARSRLAAFAPTIDRREGAVPAVVASAVDEHEPDAVCLAVGADDADPVDAAALAREGGVPVVLVPDAAL